MVIPGFWDKKIPGYLSLVFYLFLFFFIINLSTKARVGGNIKSINTVEQNTPCASVLHIFETIPRANAPTKNVAIINIEEDVNIVHIDLLYAFIIDSFTSKLFSVLILLIFPPTLAFEQLIQQ